MALAFRKMAASPPRSLLLRVSFAGLIENPGRDDREYSACNRDAGTCIEKNYETRAPEWGILEERTGNRIINSRENNASRWRRAQPWLERKRERNRRRCDSQITNLAPANGAPRECYKKMTRRYGIGSMV